MFFIIFRSNLPKTPYTKNTTIIAKFVIIEVCQGILEEY